MPKCLHKFPPPPCEEEVPGGGFCETHRPIIQNRTSFEIDIGGSEGYDPPAGSGGGGGGGWGPPSAEPPSEPPDTSRGGGYRGGGFGGGSI
jgi:hypothetical protein